MSSLLAPFRWFWLANVQVPLELKQAKRAEARISRLQDKLDEALAGCEDAALERKAIEADLAALRDASSKAEELQELLARVKSRQERSETQRDVISGQVRLLEEYVAVKEELALVNSQDIDSLTGKVDWLMVKLDTAREKRMRTAILGEQLAEEKRRDAIDESYEPRYSASTLRDVDGPAPVTARDEITSVDIEEEEEPKESVDEISI